ncbi:hypothetical protein [Streptomyces cavernae]|uniref:hypothetical protein n=1 Tax=Streptomyces cavernae TaxID=2259034 RepID=UPI000FEBF841|nr:hypothetical protein [Streptomyces cavernae]
MLVAMTFTSLIIVLSIVVICASTAVSMSTEPPFWMVLVVCLITYPLSTGLLAMPQLAKVGQGFVGEWSIRLAMAGAVTALLSLLIGKGKRGPRTRAAD